MENEFNSNFEDNIDDSSSLKSLEEFFNKKIENSFSPQEMMILAMSLNCVGNILNTYRKCTNIGVFNKETFIKKYPKYADVDFENLMSLDADTIKEINKLLRSEDLANSEEFNTGNILINNITDVIIKLTLKLYTTYTEEYNQRAPEVTEPFFTLLNNCLDSSLMILETFFKQQF